MQCEKSPTKAYKEVHKDAAFSRISDNTNDFKGIDDVRDLAFLLTKYNAKYLPSLPKGAHVIDVAEASLLFDTHLKIVAITGTNGKTTTAALIAHLLLGMGKSVALLGTSGLFINGSFIYATGFTTPFNLELLAIVDDLASRGISYLVMEASSHAIEQERLAPLIPTLRLISNVTQDHLDYHGSLEEYRRVKFSFIKDDEKPCNTDVQKVPYNKKRSIKVINLDIECLPEGLLGQDGVVSYSLCKEANFMLDFKRGMITQVISSGGKSSERISLPYTSQLHGEFNAYNILASIAATTTLLDAPLASLLALLPSFAGVKGRMQVVHKDPLVIIDFAHTEDGVLNVTKDFDRSRLRVVFGCGGDRDASKRPKMGAIAARYAAYLYITSDNPRSEDAQAIMREIEAGVIDEIASQKGDKKGDKTSHLYTKDVVKTTYKMIVDRREAIGVALKETAANEVLLILGKGSEQTQTIGDSVLHFSDAEEVARYFQSNK